MATGRHRVPGLPSPSHAHNLELWGGCQAAPARDLESSRPHSLAGPRLLSEQPPDLPGGLRESSREGTGHPPGADAPGALAAPNCPEWLRRELLPLGKVEGVPHKGGGATRDADECAHGSKAGARQRSKSHHPVLGALCLSALPAPAPKELRPPFLPSLQDFFSSLYDKEEGEAGSPTKAMTQRLKPHPGEGAPRRRGLRLQACLEESGLSRVHPKAAGLSPGQEHAGRVPLPRSEATAPHPAPSGLCQACRQEVRRRRSQWDPRENLKRLLNHSPTPKPTQCGLCDPRFRCTSAAPIPGPAGHSPGAAPPCQRKHGKARAATAATVSTVVADRASGRGGQKVNGMPVPPI